MKVRVGHSPDSDDAFMFWALANGKIDTHYEFEHILKDIQTLNEWAMMGKLETSAISAHALAYVSDKYAVLRHGGSFGENYGPMIVSSEPLTNKELQSITIAVPGKLTSAYLALNIYFHEQFGSQSKPNVEFVPFDKIMSAVKDGRYKAGLIIHEGQLTYKDEGMYLCEDLGRWWYASTDLPLPLGLNVIRKDLGEACISEINRCMKASIDLGLKNREAALKYALQFARGLSVDTSDQFVSMYVNQRTQDMGDEGIKALKLIHKKGYEIGIIPQIHIDII